MVVPVGCLMLNKSAAFWTGDMSRQSRPKPSAPVGSCDHCTIASIHHRVAFEVNDFALKIGAMAYA
jgi:hypothetical protein